MNKPDGSTGIIISIKCNFKFLIMKNLLTIVCFIFCVGFATTSWGMIPEMEDNPIEIVDLVDYDVTISVAEFTPVDLQINDINYNSFVKQENAETIFVVTSEKFIDVAVPDIPIMVMRYNDTYKNLQEDTIPDNYNKLSAFKYLKRQHSEVSYDNPYIETKRLSSWRV